MANVIAVVRDLIFASKISGTARALGIGAAVVASADALQAGLDEKDVALVMVDMSLPNDEAAAALRCAAAHASMPTSVAFFSHVQAELRDAAEQAGATIILARSSFTEQLPELIREHCGAGE